MFTHNKADVGQYELDVETESKLIFVYSANEGDGGKNEVIGYLHVQQGVSVEWAP